MSRRMVHAVFAVVLLVPAGCHTYRERQDFDLKVPWRDYQRVVVRTNNGSVELSKADVPEIRIRGAKHASAPTLAKARERLERVTIVAEPDPTDSSVLRVTVKSPLLLGGGGTGASFEIQVPASCAADIRTSNGRIVVSELKGDSLLETSNGEVVIDGVNGEVRARTSNGRITARDMTGDLTAVTHNGAIQVEAAGGDCDLETSNGKVHAVDLRGSVRARTSNVGIRLDAAPPEKGEVVLRTSNGSLHLTLPASLRADLDLRTSNGLVQMNLQDVPLRARLWSQNRVKAKMNDGGGSTITATTSNGLITVESR